MQRAFPTMLLAFRRGVVLSVRYQVYLSFASSKLSGLRGLSSEAVSVCFRRDPVVIAELEKRGYPSE